MKIDYDGRLWDFSLEDMTVGQCETVEKYVGKGLGDWANQMTAGGTKAIVALWWVMRAQTGDNPGPIGQPGDLRPVRLLSAFGEAADAELAARQAEAEAGGEPDPTLVPGSSPEPGPTTTTPGSVPPAPYPPG